MDTRMIEVALGLALVFALSSLLVTAMRELWASAWGSRGKVLQQAMTSFLGDDKVFTGILMQHPLLVSLAKAPSGGKPSYMGADIVVTSLVGSLVDRCAGGQRPSSPAQFVEAVRVASQVLGKAKATDKADRFALPNDKLTEGLQSLVHGVENDWPGYEARLCAWYDAVTERSVGWFKRKNQVSLLIFGFMVAAAANINPLAIAPRLWQDTSMRQALASAAEKAGDAYATANANANAKPSEANPPAATRQTGRSIASKDIREAQARRNALVVETEQKLYAVKARLESDLDTLSTQATGSAWRDINQGYQQVLALRGALDLARQPGDGSNMALRKQLEASGQIEKALTSLSALAQTTSATRYALQPLQVDLDKAVTAERNAGAALAALMRTATGVGDNVSDACLSNSAIAIGDLHLQDFCQRLNDLNSLKATGIPIGWGGSVTPEIFESKCAPTETCRDIQRVGNALLVVVGWLITAVAASLGAPFWFDLLNKVAKLRASGTRPSAADEAGAVRTPPGGTTMSLPSGMPQPGAGPGSVSAANAARGESEPMSDAFNADEKALGRSEVRRVQIALGLPPDQISGSFDGVTRQAIKTWQRRMSYGDSAELTARQIDELLNSRPPVVSTEIASPRTPVPTVVPSATAPFAPIEPFSPLLRAIADGGAAVPLDSLGIEKGLAREIQSMLTRIGLLDPPADGAFGPVSLWALDEFQKAMGMASNGHIDSALARLLLSNKAWERFPILETHTLAGRIATAMLKKGYWLCRHPKAVNIIYVEGMDVNGNSNANTPNHFNDLRTVLCIDEKGEPWLAGCWDATSEPGRYYTQNPMDGTPGVARIALGQFKAWVVGKHKQTQPALVQAAPLFIYRDLNKNYRRDEGERVSIGSTINQHSGYGSTVNNIGKASAGCLVGRTIEGHNEFMALCYQDPRYLASNGYRFMTAVLEAADAL